MRPIYTRTLKFVATSLAIICGNECARDRSPKIECWVVPSRSKQILDNVEVRKAAPVDSGVIYLWRNVNCVQIYDGSLHYSASLPLKIVSKVCEYARCFGVGWLRASLRKCDCSTISQYLYLQLNMRTSFLQPRTAPSIFRNWIFRISQAIRFSFMLDHNSTITKTITTVIIP